MEKKRFTMFLKEIYGNRIYSKPRGKYDGKEVDEKYLNNKNIINVMLVAGERDSLFVEFEADFDEEAIARDKKKTEEDALIERVTKLVLKEIEEKDKKTINVEGAELPNILLEQLNKTIQDSLKQLKQSFESDLKSIDNKEIKPYPTEKCNMFPY